VRTANRRGSQFELGLSSKQQQPKEPVAKTLIKPSTIRETPPRLTPPPKKTRSPNWIPKNAAMLVVLIVAVVLLLWIFVYLRQLSHSLQASRPIASVIVENLKEELRSLKEKVEAIERLLNEL
jgi:hypothetical protein